MLQWFEYIKVCIGTQRFCWKSQFCLSFVNKIYLPCCRSNAISASYCSVGSHSSGNPQKQYNSSRCELGPPVFRVTIRTDKVRYAQQKSTGCYLIG